MKKFYYLVFFISFSQAMRIQQITKIAIPTLFKRSYQISIDKVVDADGNTALHNACKEDNVLKARDLLRQGANYTKKNILGLLPEDYAKNKDITTLLAHHKVINKRLYDCTHINQEEFNKNPLKYDILQATSAGILINNGARPDAPVLTHKTASHNARENAEHLPLTFAVIKAGEIMYEQKEIDNKTSFFNQETLHTAQLILSCFDAKNDQ